MTSCSQINNELSELNDNISQLLGKTTSPQNFVTRREFDSFKFNILSRIAKLEQSQRHQSANNNQNRVLDRINKSLDKVQKDANDALDWIQGQRRKNDPIWAALKEEIKRRETEDYKLWYELRYWKDIINAQKINAEIARKQAEAAEKKAEDALMKWEKAFADIARISGEVAGIKINLATLNAAVKGIVAGLPTLIKYTVLSLLISGIFNAVLSEIMKRLFPNVSKIEQQNQNITPAQYPYVSPAKMWEKIIEVEKQSKEADKKADKALIDIDIIRNSATKAFTQVNNELQFLTKSTRDALVRLQDRIKINEDTFTGFKAGIQAQIDGLLKKIPALEVTPGQIAGLTAQVAGLVIGFGALQRLIGRGTMIQQNTYYVTNNYDQRQTTIINQPSPNQNIDLTEIKQRVRVIDTTTKANFALSGVMDVKLGDQITSGSEKIGISGGLLRIGNNMVTDRMLNLIATAASVHNALMLSKSIGDTLAATIDTIIGLFGIKDGNGTAYSVTAVLGKTVKQWLEGLIGANNYTKLSETFAKANRIYQSTSNLYSSVRQLFDSSFQLGETIAENTGKIGNALRDHGVIASDAYNKMSERYQAIRDKKFVRMTEGLERVDNIASSLSSITTDVKDVADEIKEVKDQRKEFEKNLKELAPNRTQIDNKPVAEREKKLDRATEPPLIKEGDENGK